MKLNIGLNKTWLILVTTLLYPIIGFEIEAQELAKRQNKFIGDFYKAVTKQKTSNENFVICPIGVQISMAMLMNGANNKAQSEIIDALGYKGVSEEDINTYNHQLLNTIKGANKELLISNGLWIDKHKKINQDYTKTMEETYAANLFPVDFKNTGFVSESIRAWGYEKTNGLIDFTPKLTENTCLYGANATYFKGLWENEPEIGEQTKIFHNRNGKTSSIKYLYYNHKSVQFFNNRYYKAIKLYYKGRQYSMIIVLPKTGIASLSELKLEKTEFDPLPKIKKYPTKISYQLRLTKGRYDWRNREKVFLPSKNFLPALTDFLDIDLEEKETEERLESQNEEYIAEEERRYNYLDIDSISKLIDWQGMSFESNRFEYISFPQFENTSEIDIKEVLEEMKVKTIFEKRANSLNRIADSLYLKDIGQLVKIKVDQKGTEAAALSHWSSWCVGGIGDYEQRKFIVDRPFLYAIKDERSGAILFVGRVVTM